MYIWAQRGAPGAAAATSSSDEVAAIETMYTAPTDAAPRAVASSPSSQKKRCIAVGATRIGDGTSIPSTVVRVCESDTSRNTWGRRRRRTQASTFAPRVTLSAKPRAR